jgi:glycosyltransferase involved in cell wall biosynthesis
MGKTVALAVGFKKCRSAIVATLDADLQNDPADIPAMVTALSGGSDFVCGWRAKRQDSVDKTIPSHLINLAVPLLSELKIHDINCGLKVFKREIIPRIHLFGKQHRYIPLKAYYSGFQVTEMKVNHRPRKHGHSKYGFLRFPEGIFDLITTLFMGKFDKSPFYLFGGAGLALFLTGSLILGWLSIGWFFGQWISHRPLFELAILLVTFGFQMVSIGLLAEMFINMIHPAPDPPLEEFTPSPEEKSAIQDDSPDRDQNRNRNQSA